MTGDLISREALLKEVRENKELFEKERVYLEGLLLNAPTVEERPHGEWLHKEFDPFLKEYGQCSNCLQRERVGNFCRNCGSYNRGDIKNDGN